MSGQTPPVPDDRLFGTKDRLKTTDYVRPFPRQHHDDHVYEPLRCTSERTTPFQEVSFQLNCDDPVNTTVCFIVSSSKLPFVVKVKRQFIGLGNDPVKLQKDDLLLFHFIGRVRRVLAIDKHDKKILLPIQAKQVYDILPNVPKYDDKVFHGTEAVIVTNPLPDRLRILEAHYSMIAEESQEVGDVIEVSHVERRRVLPHRAGSCNRAGVSNRVLVGSYNNNNTFAFPESMTCSTYTAMICDKPRTLSEILEKYPPPVRVRKPQDKCVFLLKEYRDDIVVIATHFESNQVLAIPLTCKIDVEKETNLGTERLLQGLLPALYPLLNCSYGIVEVGRTPLPENLRQIPQPIMKVLDQWKDSYEGQQFLQMNLKGKNKYLQYEQMEANAKTCRKKMSSAPRSIQPVPPKLPPKPSPSQTRVSHDASDANRAPPNIPPRDDTEDLLNKKEEVIKKLNQENKDLREKYENLKETLTQDGEFSKKLNHQDFEHKSKMTVQSVLEDSVIDNRSSNYVKLLKASVEEVGLFLKDLELDCYVRRFRDEVVDGELLIRLDEGILHEDIGMKKIHARRLMLEVSKRLRNEEDSDKLRDAVAHQEGKDESLGPVKNIL